MVDVLIVPNGYLSEIFLSFQGEGLHAGRRQLFLRLSGCPLRCRYCDTPASLERQPRARIHQHDGTWVEIPNPVAASDVLGHAGPLLDAGGGADGLAVTGGEPLVQADFLAGLLGHPLWPRPRLLETSGTMPDQLTIVLPVIDVVSMDIKLPSNTGEGPQWERHARFLAAAADKAYVKVLVDEGTATAEVERAAALVADTAPAAPLFLQPVTNPSGGPALGIAALERFFGAARRHVADVRVLPQVHKALGVP